MKIEEYNFSYAKSAKGVSKMVNIRWNITNFYYQINLENNMKFLTNRRCYAKDFDDDLKFDLMVKYTGKLQDGRLLLNIYYSAPNDVKLLECSIFDMYNCRRGDHLIAKRSSCSVPANQWQVLPIVSGQFLGNINNFLSDAILGLDIEFVIQNSAFVTHTDEFANVSNPTLSDHLEKLLEDPTSSDVTLKSIEEVELPAHKLILIARSAVLKAHFDHGTKESLTNVIETSLDTDALEELLRYIYTDKAPNLDDMAEELLVAADYYQLDGLKTLCEKALYADLCVENAIETLVLADTHSAAMLKMLTIQYINDGHIDEVMRTDGWKTMKSPDLIKSIFEYNLN